MNAPVRISVRVRFFASLREAVARDSVDLVLADASLDGLKAELAGILGDAFAAIDAPGVQVAVNQALVRGDARLGAGDEVAFLPPVTGG